MPVKYNNSDKSSIGKIPGGGPADCNIPDQNIFSGKSLPGNRFGDQDRMTMPPGTDNGWVETVRLDYDLAKWKKTASLFGSCLRSKLFDEQVTRFLSLHPRGTIVEVGAGLNTRYERLDNGHAFVLPVYDGLFSRGIAQKDQWIPHQPVSIYGITPELGGRSCKKAIFQRYFKT